MEEIKYVDVEKLLDNPWRNMKEYPINAEKVDVLRASMERIGVWAGIHVRPAKGRRGYYELAFGHTRREAALAAEIRKLPVIVNDYSDEEMVVMMSQENDEVYGSEFLVQFNSFDGAWRFLTETDPNFATSAHKGLQIAKLIGWMQSQKNGKGKSEVVMSMKARACEVVHGLRIAGHISLKAYDGLTVRQAYDISNVALEKLRLLEKQRDTVENYGERKRDIVEATKETLSEMRDKAIPSRDASKTARRKIAERTGDKAALKDLPLFPKVGGNIAERLQNFLNYDTLAEKLEAVERNVGKFKVREDINALNRVITELDELAKRARRWSERLGGKRLAVIK